MTRTFHITLFSLLFLFNVNAQEVLIPAWFHLWKSDNLCEIGDLGCEWQSLDKGTLVGYGYHPNGELWLCLNESLPGGQVILNVYSLEAETCDFTLMESVPLPIYWIISDRGINIDYQGHLYLFIYEIDQANGEAVKTISKIKDISNPTFERQLILTYDWYPSEIHFQDGKVYMTEYDQSHIYAFDMDFNILDTIYMPKLILGLTNFSYGCDSSLTLATHYNINYSEGEWDQFDSIFYISKYDLSTNTLTSFCSFPINHIVDGGPLTSPLEFLSSDPECDLLIDLDRDNSSGSYPYDYYDSTVHCTTVEVPVCDSDVYIHSSAPIDSILLVLSGVRDQGEERLSITQLPTELVFTQLNDSTYLLKAIAVASDSVYREALLQLRYLHMGSQRTGGERQVFVQGFNAVKEGTLIKAQLFVSGIPYAGEDATLLICADTVIETLSAITLGQSNGVWDPGLVSGEDLFNSLVDIADAYTYIVSDPLCGSDSSLVTVVRDQFAEVDLLGPDRVLCPEDSLFLSIDEEMGFVLWDNGSFEHERVILEPGHYAITLATDAGCEYQDAITVDPADVLIPEYVISDPACGSDNGSVSIDPSDFEASGSMLLDGIPLNSPEIDHLAAGDYLLTTISEDLCSTDIWITLSESASFEVFLQPWVEVARSTWTTLSYEVTPGAEIAQVIFSPDNGITWNGNTIEVYGEANQEYTITVIDVNGCETTLALEVRVEEGDGVYIPNIFNPSSTSGNATWRPFYTEEYQFEHIEIYDRWGSLVHGSKVSPEWDGIQTNGRIVQGVYVYRLTLKQGSEGKAREFVGDVTLIQ